VDEMAQVLDNAMYAPTVGRYKVYVIDEVHMLTNHAFNAMLKTLEEPPPHVCFVLATTDPQKVPVTVLSRCMQFNLRNLAPLTIADRLRYVLQQEEVTFDEPSLMRLGRAANGSMRDSLSLLDQAIAFGGGEVSDAIVMEMLGLVDSVFVDHILQALIQNNGAQMVALADELQANGGAFEQVLLDLAREFQQLALAAEGLGEHTEARTEMAAAFGPQAIQVYYQIAIHGMRDLALAPDAHTGFVMSLLRLLAFVPTSGPSVSASTKQVFGQNAIPATATTAKATARPAPPQRATIAQPPAASAPPSAVAPTRATTPSPVSSSANAAPTLGVVREFDGDWPSLSKQLRLMGFAQQFMQQSQLVAYEALQPGYAFTVRVPIKILAESANVNKVRDALVQYLGQPVRITPEVGLVETGTAAMVVAGEKAQAQADAESAIGNDLFVQGMQKEFGATIVPGSIVPNSVSNLTPSSNS
jgi:DNA polymerase III subunit gamma/tau